MKPEEAIEVLTSPNTHFGTYKCDGEEWKKIKPAVELAVSALKKQVPKKPEVRESEVSGKYYRCPKCIRIVGLMVPYCRICGQCID